MSSKQEQFKNNYISEKPAVLEFSKSDRIEYQRKHRLDVLRRMRIEIRRKKIEEGRGEARREFEEMQENNEENNFENFNDAWDFKKNRKLFKKWKEDFVKDPEAISIEQYVASKQREKVDVIWEEKLNQTLDKHLVTIYDEESEEGEERGAGEKNESVKTDVYNSVKSYFDVNREGLLQYVEIKDPEKKLELKTKLLRAFGLQVFSDIYDEESEDFSKIEPLWSDLIIDFQEYHETLIKLDLVGDKMVALLEQENLTEDEWYEQILEEVTDEEEKLDSSGGIRNDYEAASTSNFSSDYFSHDLYGDAYAAMPDDAKIKVLPGPKRGAYLLKFPGGDALMASEFYVKIVRNENGPPTILYLFKDRFSDGEKIVQNRENFIKEVNARYLDFIMNRSVRAIEYYNGPNLNNGFMNDRIMMTIAEKFFRRVDLGSKVLTRRQVENFQKLILILVNSDDEGLKDTIYGGLLATGSRVALLDLLLTDRNRAEACYRYLENDLTMEDVRSLNIADLSMRMFLPANSGRFSRQILSSKKS